MSEQQVFKIEKSVPMPRAQNAWCKYPYKTMEIGDSFQMSMDDYPSVRTGCHAYGKKYGMKFSVRKINDEVARCWRTA